MLRMLSLSRRLTLFFTILAATIVVGLGLLFMLASEEHFNELDRVTLQDKQHLIEDILASSVSLDDAGQRLGEALRNHHGLYARVGTQDGRILTQSDGFPPSAGLQTQVWPSQKISFQRWQNGAQQFHVLSAQASAAYAADEPLSVLVALDMRHHIEFMQQLRATLISYALVATLISGLLAWLAAHYGLAPLRAMKAKAAAVTSAQLAQRMPVEAVPIEMADLAQELNRMLARLQDDFQRLSEFSSDLAHELRTPISNLLTQTQVALSYKRDAATYQEILASNAEELQRLARMVADMLFLAKTERGVDLPHKENFSLAQEALALIEFYEALAEEKQIALTLQGEGSISGDRLMFRRALSNLISNAIHHCPAAGQISVKIESTAQATIVSVANAGEGIDPKVLSRLFDRFYRADPARAHPDSQGAGLGLSITRAIVEAHGGSISVQSEAGHTEFSIIFPQA